MAQARALAEGGQRIGEIAGACGVAGRSSGVDGDQLSGASRRTRPYGLRAFPSAQVAGGKWRDRECRSSGDQFADEREQYFLDRGERGSDVGIAWPGIESS